MARALQQYFVELLDDDPVAASEGITHEELTRALMHAEGLVAMLGAVIRRMPGR